MECPNCQAAFEVPDDRLRTVRKLRCSCCGEAWRNSHAEVEKAAADAVGPEYGFEGALVSDHPVVPEVSQGRWGRATARKGRVEGRSGSVSGTDAKRASHSGGGVVGWVVAWAGSVASVAMAGCALWHWRLIVAQALSGVVH